MKKTKKTIIYMLVVAVSAVFVDFGSCYAQSYSEDVYDAEWHYFNANGEDSVDKLELYDYDEVGTDIKIPSDSKINDCKYIEKFTRASKDGDYDPAIYDYVIGSNSEVVLVYENYGAASSNGFFYHASSSYTEGTYSYLISKDTFYYYGGSVKEKGSGYNYDFYTYESTSWSGLYLAVTEHGAYKYHVNYKAINSHKMKVFFSVADAKKYLNDGDTSGLAWQGGEPKQTYDSELLLNDFDVQFHDSNKFEECYLDVKYTVPDALKSVSSFQIDMEEKFDWCGTISGGFHDMNDSHTGTNYIDVLNHADGFRVYLKDIDAISNFVLKWDGAFDKLFKRFVIGNLNYVNFPFADYVIGSVKVSNLNIKFHLVADKKYGHYVDYNLNLLTGIGVKNSYVPDNDGNYTSNNDSKVNGHYYTDVGTDAAGNTTYNYYYYYSDGSKEKVSSEDAANNTVSSTIEDGAIRIDNSPTFNNNITVEGDTISNSANSYADSKSDATTNKSFIDKFLGFFDIIENNSFLGVFGKIFGWLPTGISSLITTAIGIIVGIRVFKAFH